MQVCVVDHTERNRILRERDRFREQLQEVFALRLIVLDHEQSLPLAVEESLDPGDRSDQVFPLDRLDYGSAATSQAPVVVSGGS